VPSRAVMVTVVFVVQRKDGNNVISELFGIRMQEYGSGWEDLLPMQCLRAMVVFGSCARREAVRLQEGLSAPLAVDWAGAAAAKHATRHLGQAESLLFLCDTSAPPNLRHQHQQAALFFLAR